MAATATALVRHAVAHAFDPGMHVAGTLERLHVLCTATLTFYAVHARRGRDALAAIGLLASLRGILVHDHRAAYRVYDCQHASCSARHPRELIAIAETYPGLPWPKPLVALLCEANEATCMARAAGLSALPGAIVEDIFTHYDALLAEGARCHPRRTGPRVGADGSSRPLATTSSAASATTARRSCASSPTCASRSTKTWPSALSAWPLLK